jgi:hypothetical protein
MEMMFCEVDWWIDSWDDLWMIYIYNDNYYPQPPFDDHQTSHYVSLNFFTMFREWQLPRFFCHLSQFSAQIPQDLRFHMATRVDFWDEHP